MSWTLSVTLLIASLLPGSAPAAADVTFRYPYLASEDYPITQSPGGRFSHVGAAANAYDFGIPEDRVVAAAADGEIVVAYDESNSGGCDVRFWTRANRLVIRHADGTDTLYMHLAHGSITRRTGVVRAGEPVAAAGRTGWTCNGAGSGPGAHLHIQRQRGSSATNWFQSSITMTFAGPQVSASPSPVARTGTPAPTRAPTTAPTQRPVTPAPTPSLSISGRLTCEDGQPVPDVYVWARPWPLGSSRSTIDGRTDANGNFSLRVTAGSYNLHLGVPLWSLGYGYADFWYVGTGLLQAATSPSTAHLQVGSTIAGLGLVLPGYSQLSAGHRVCGAPKPTITPTSGSLSGRVLGAGLPASGVQVNLGYVSVPGSSTPVTLSTRTDAEGGFRFDSVPAGTYFIGVLGVNAGYETDRVVTNVRISAGVSTLDPIDIGAKSH